MYKRQATHFAMRCARKEAALFVRYLETPRKKIYLISNYEFNLVPFLSSETCLPFTRLLLPQPPPAFPAVSDVSASTLLLPFARHVVPTPSLHPGRQLHLALHLSNTFLDRKLIKFSNSHKSATFFNLRLHKLAGTYRQRGKPRL